jgi:hypothetical protein
MDQPWDEGKSPALPFWRRPLFCLLAGGALLLVLGFGMGWSSARMTEPPQPDEVVGPPPPPPESLSISVTLAPPLPVSD